LLSFEIQESSVFILSIEEQKIKMKEWMENGCRFGWLIDADE
jgi:hypothetical protein